MKVDKVHFQPHIDYVTISQWLQQKPMYQGNRPSSDVVAREVVKNVKKGLQILLDDAKSKGYFISVNKNGKVGKGSSLEKLDINVRKYVIDFGEISISYHRLQALEIQGNLLIIHGVDHQYAVKIN